MDMEPAGELDYYTFPQPYLLRLFSFVGFRAGSSCLDLLLDIWIPFIQSSTQLTKISPSLRLGIS
jgi:hypothetical protein